jgi:hypothetical protein
MGIEAVVARTLQVLLALGGAYLVALWFVLVVWTYRDIEARSRNVVTQVFSTLLVVLFWIPGVLLYLILRPKDTLDGAYQRSLEEEYLLQDLEELPLCPSCERYVEDDFVLCPHCHTRLREPCLSCVRLIDLRWSVCPYCGAAQGGEAVGKPEQVEAPAARWRASGRPRRTVAEPAAPAAASEPRGPEPDADRVVAAVAAPEPASRDDAEEPAPIAAEAPMAAAEPREPIPLVPLPRGRFRRVEAPRPASANGSAEQATEEMVPTGGLFTSILGSRSGDQARLASNGARSRRAARHGERSSIRDDATAANGRGNGVVHDLEGFNGIVSASDGATSDRASAHRERDRQPVRAEGKGD